MSPRWIIAAIGAAVAIVGLVVLGTNVTAYTATGTLDCGTGFASNMQHLQHEDAVNGLANALNGGGSVFQTGQAQACASPLSSRRTIGWVVFGIGVVAAFGGLLVRGSKPRPARPTVAAPAVGSAWPCPAHDRYGNVCTLNQGHAGDCVFEAASIRGQAG